MTDARNQRFEVPTDIPKATRKAPNPSYKVYISKTGSPFALTVKRKGETVDRTMWVLLSWTIEQPVVTNRSYCHS